MKNTQENRLRIEMVHDMVCSWCPIGFRNIQAAIKALNIEVEFGFLPFELNPSMSEDGQLISDYFKQQFRWSDNKLKQYQTDLVATAKNAGVCIDFSKRRYYFNTHKAHRLMHWVHGFNKQIEFNEYLIKAYFELGLDISQTEVLLQIIMDIGLDPNSARLALEDPQIEQALMQKVERYMAFNITSIPTFILDGSYLLQGSSSVSELIHQLGQYLKSKAA